MNQTILSLAILLFSFFQLSAQVNPKDVTIVRDSYGVPHIYAKTDAGMTYGLVWAACEDDFNSIQENFLAIRGELAKHKGKDGAIMDVLAHVVDARPAARRLYKEGVYSPEFTKMLKAYVQAFNDYAAAHPEKVWDKKMLPATEEDVVAAHVLAISIITTVQFNIVKILENKMDLDEIPQSAGSNSFAVNKDKTKNGETFLAINSHQPLVGPYSWYEAHLNSEESGINIQGASFPGGMSLFIGANENLGWCHTLNFPDHCDVYKLKMHPSKKNHYEFDGKWEKLEKHPVKLRVKVGPIKIPVRKMFYRSKLGVVIKNKDGYYALRFRANMEIMAAQGWYELNKATNLEEFKSVLEKQYIPATNVIYGDKEGNIFYASMGNFPYRDPAYKWDKVLPGNKSELLWGNERHPFSEMPKLENPASGYVYNTNNPPFNCSAPEDSLDPTKYQGKGFNFQVNENNRGVRYRYLMEQEDKIDYDDFKRIKYDNDYHKPFYTWAIANGEELFQMDENKYPDLKDMILKLKKWNRSADPENMEAAVASITFHLLVNHLFKIGRLPSHQEVEVDEATFVQFLRKGKKHLKKHFGTIDIPLGDLQRLVRDKDHDFPVGGMPEVLAAMNFNMGKKGRLEAFLGECFIQMVQWTDEGVKIESVNAFGQSHVPGNKHYLDQTPLFLKQQLKPMTLDKEEVFKNAERVYHPEKK